MIVVSDLEGTLTTGATWKAFAEHLKMNGKERAYQVFYASQIPRYFLAQAGIINKQDFRNRWIETLFKLLKATSLEQVDDLSEWIVETELWPKRRHDILTEFEIRRNNNSRIIVTSGVFEPVAKAFAKRIDAEYIGTPVHLVNGIVEVTHPPNTRERKAENIRTLIGDAALTIAYGDTAADIPMLKMAEHPVAVHPDKTLRKLAEERGWRIHDDDPDLHVGESDHDSTEDDI